MPLISASDLSVSFAELDVFEGISLEVSERARVGIVGPNGQGKTTLLETLVGDIAPRSGSVRRNRGLSIGYVPQTTRHMDAETLGEEVMKAFAEITHIEVEIALSAANIERASEDNRKDAERRYSDMLEAYEAAGGYDYENRLERVIAGVGLKMENSRSACRRGERRPAHPRVPRKGAAGRAAPAHPRRADQLPRLRRTQLAGGLPAPNISRFRRRLARPLLPRSGRDRDMGRSTTAGSPRTRGTTASTATSRPRASDGSRPSTCGSSSSSGNRRTSSSAIAPDSVHERPSAGKSASTGWSVSRPPGPTRLSTSERRVRPGPAGSSSRHKASKSDSTRAAGRSSCWISKTLHSNGASRTAIIGPNGIGKTTFLHTVLGYEPALAGSASLATTSGLGSSDRAPTTCRSIAQSSTRSST